MPHAPHPRSRGAGAGAAAIVVGIALVGGCWGTAVQPGGAGHGTTSALAVSGSASAMSSSLVASASVSARPTSWPLPYASYYVGMPPAGASGGPTRPCPPHVDWGKTAPSPVSSAQDGGVRCSDFTPVRYPICSAEQVARAVRIDAFLDPKARVAYHWGHSAFALRGYLRRSEAYDARGRGGSATRLWQLRLEAGIGDACREIGVRDWPWGSDPPPPLGRPDGIDGWLCRGDADVTCCLSAIVDSDREVVFETGNEPGQMCVIDATAEQAQIRMVRRQDEASTTRPAVPSGYLP